MNKLRQELQGILAEIPVRRPPALRRSLLEDWLYATDLPRAAEETAVAAFCRKAEEHGWRTAATDGWIQLDRIPEIIPEPVFGGPFGTEAACCASLLRRHPGERKAEREIRLLIKAAEEGKEAYEKVCAGLHREWASALRKGEALPALATAYFEGGDTDADPSDCPR